jgi:group I intron endonuclease
MAIYSIYRFTNLVNNKVYIGLTTSKPEARKYAHLQAAKRGSPLLIHNAIRKYGESQFLFEVLFNAFDKNDLGDFERYFIEVHDCCRLDGPHKGYNMTRGGEGFDSEQARALIERRTQEGTNPWAGELGTAHSKALAERLKAEGRHPSQNPEWIEARAEEVRERVANGTHHWLGEDWSKTVSQKNKERAAKGKHVWQSEGH